MKVYPTNVEAVDDAGDVVFRVHTFDEHTASIEIQPTVFSEASLEELCAALRQAFKLLELK